MILLASQSSRRRELLDQIGVQYQTIRVKTDESWLEKESSTEYVKRVTLAKAHAGLKIAPGNPILAADTCVVLDNIPMGKPRDEAHGLQMLASLSGRTHQVITGVALLHQHMEYYCLGESRVRFCDIDVAQARRYWATGEPLDKAGGYAIQGRGALFIEHISGSYSGIMGLPLFETGQMLGKAGLLRV